MYACMYVCMYVCVYIYIYVCVYIYILSGRNQFRPDPARNLSANLYDIYHCCVYSEKLLMMDRGTVGNMWSFISENKFEKLVHLVGFIVRNHHDARSPEPQNVFIYLFLCSNLNAHPVNRLS